MDFFTNNPSFPVGLKVLAVDHDIGDLCTIQNICNYLCYQVITCCTISDAWNCLVNQNFDMILIEANMPSNDTFDFVGQITSHFKVPVVVMSLDQTKDSVMKSINKGACAYWAKPFDENQFKTMWQHVVRNSLSQQSELQIVPNTLSQQSELLQIVPNTLSQQSEPFQFLQTMEVKVSGKKRVREDANVTKQPLPKKSRLSWTHDLHEQFLSAVNQLGVNNAAPKEILKLMNVRGLTVGHVASHLQKYKKYLKGEIKKSKFSAFQGHNDEIPTQQQHLTEIGESDIFFDLSDLFPDLVNEF